MRRSARVRGAATIAAFATIAATAPVFAKENPQKPERGVSASTSAPRFECGTYKGNENESLSLYHRYLSAIQRSPKAASAADFVYDDVWVVEDDGSILISGNNPFDTDTRTFRFSPNASSGYDIVSLAISYDPTLGVILNLGDDGNATLGLGFEFDYYGTTWNDIHVSSNGAVSFGGDVNPSGFFDNQDFFSSLPKIAAYFMDLDPSAGGAVYHKAESTKSTITWSNVPEFGTSNTNTIQLVIRDDHSFDITFVGIASTSQANGSPITLGINPGGSGALNLISFSDDLPYSGPAGAGAYEHYVNLTNPIVNDVA